MPDRIHGERLVPVVGRNIRREGEAWARSRAQADPAVHLQAGTHLTAPPPDAGGRVRQAAGTPLTKGVISRHMRRRRGLSLFEISNPCRWRRGREAEGTRLLNEHTP